MAGAEEVLTVQRTTIHTLALAETPFPASPTLYRPSLLPFRTSSDTSSAPSTLPGSACRAAAVPLSMSACRRINASTSASSSSCVMSLSYAATL